MTLVADSGALYALYDAEDKHHAAVTKVIKSERGLIIVPSVILSELDYLLREFLGVDAELAFLDGILSGFYTVEQFSEDDVATCQELIAKYRDLDLGLADAGVIAAAQRLGVPRILTVDERDFRAVKLPKFKFTILPADG